jgi:decaprenylphospho-beta-D-ribofuranose 2-oxidase
MFLTGWGRSMSSRSEVIATSSSSVVREVFANVGSSDHLHKLHRGVTIRGLGRSYGDCALNSGGVVLLTHGNNPSHGDLSTIEVDVSAGVATVGGGVSIEDLLRVTVPSGWFVPVTPGTRFVTVGGAIAADVHGKNHHRDGTFGSHVISMKVLLSSGDVVDLNPINNPKWFWATVGGMGLTGMILEAKIALIPISSSLLSVDTQRHSHLDSLMASMNEKDVDDTFRYSVAWVDMLATGKNLGRGVLTRGNHLDVESSSQSGVGSMHPSLVYEPKTRISAPRFVPNGILNKMTIRAFNEAWFRRAPSVSRTTHESISGFFHPLDGVRHWNHLYGSHGFLQYQFVVPPLGCDVVRKVIEKLQKSSVPSFLAVLKRMGPANLAPLSFPMEGWTLAVDIAIGSRHLATTLEECDDMVIAAGGRHYLAKDAHMSQSIFESGYPALSNWQETRNEMDPIGVFINDQARRLHMKGDVL